MSGKKAKPKKTNFVIALAKPSDAKDILEVKNKTWLATYPNREYKISKALILSMDITGSVQLERQKEKLKKKNIRVWIARKGDKIVGYGTAKRDNKENYLGSLYILPSFQGQGIGKGIMNRILKWLGGTKPIHSKVVEYNTKAIRFYKKFGFVITQTHTYGPKLPDGRRFPSVEIKKFF